MAANDPTKHHYIPEFHLRWWAGEDGRFERYNRPIPSKIMVRRSFPSEAGWLKNLYTSPGDRSGDEWLEKSIFQVIDSRAAKALAIMNSEPPREPEANLRSAWTMYLRSLYHRTPDALAGTLARGTRTFDDALETARDRYPELRQPTDPDTFEEYRASMTAADKRRTALGALPQIMGNQKMGQFIQDMHTAILTMPSEARDFLISDNPMARTNGLKTDQGHIAIPISPKKLFVAAYREETLAGLMGAKPDVLVTLTNTWVVESARYFVAARDRTQDRFIRNRFGRYPKPPLLK